MVTVLALPVFLLANVPVALALFRMTVSPLTTPTNAAPPVLSVTVVVPSYVLLLAVMADTVSALAGLKPAGFFAEVTVVLFCAIPSVNRTLRTNRLPPPHGHTMD